MKKYPAPANPSWLKLVFLKVSEVRVEYLEILITINKQKDNYDNS